MPRVPKNIPAWIEDFVTFATRKEKNKNKKLLLAEMTSLFHEYWEAFADKANEEAPAPQKRVTDPVKTVEKALKKAVSNVAELNTPEEKAEFKQRLLTAVPPEIQTLLNPTLEQINTLYVETELGKTHLETLAQQPPNHFEQNALQVVNRVYQSLGSLKLHLDDQETDAMEE